MTDDRTQVEKISDEMISAILKHHEGVNDDLIDAIIIVLHSVLGGHPNETEAADRLINAIRVDAAAA